MRLYHLTNVHHLFEIEEDGFLEVTESNIGAPISVNGEYLPTMVGVVLPTEAEGLDDSDPRHPDWVPTCMPAAVYRQMYEDGSPPEMIDPARFSDAVMKHPSYRVTDGKPSVGMRVVLGWESDSRTPEVTYAEAGNVIENQFGAVQFGEHVGPDVVWLTSNPAPRQGWQTIPGQDTPYVFRKHAVLFTVEVPDEHVIHWPEFARAHNILDWWYDQLDSSGDGQAEQWYVMPRRIPREEWVSIHNTETGSAYWTREQGHLEGDDRFLVPLPHFWVHHPLNQVV